MAVPPEPIGCERCGLPARELVVSPFPSSGEITAHAVVHHHARPEPPTPFVVVEVRLDAGPVVRALLRDASPDEMSIGRRVDGSLDGDRFSFVPAAADAP